MKSCFAILFNLGQKVTKKSYLHDAIQKFDMNQYVHIVALQPPVEAEDVKVSLVLIQ